MRLNLSAEERCDGCVDLQVHDRGEFLDFFCAKFQHPVGRIFRESEKNVHHGWGPERIEDQCHYGG